MKSNVDQRHKSRLVQQNLELERLNAHALVARMLKDENASQAVVNEAKVQIKKWRDNQLCSVDYIQEWEVLLRNPIKAAEILEDMSPISIRLRQNSPFSKYLK
jgi:hypothetical protein